jgi:hypothetical protein
MTMGMLWLLTATLPYRYTHTEKDTDPSLHASTTKNPLLTSYQFLMKLVSKHVQFILIIKELIYVNLCFISYLDIGYIGSTLIMLELHVYSCQC